jgi:hypothetical protein
LSFFPLLFLSFFFSEVVDVERVSAVETHFASSFFFFFFFFLLQKKIKRKTPGRGLEGSGHGIDRRQGPVPVRLGRDQQEPRVRRERESFERFSFVQVSRGRREKAREKQKTHLFYFPPFFSLNPQHAFFLLSLRKKQRVLDSGDGRGAQEQPQADFTVLADHG